MRKITVCHNCTERYIGCHGSCERYLTEKREQDAIVAEMMALHNREKDVTEFQVGGKLKAMKRMRKNGGKV